MSDVLPSKNVWLTFYGKNGRLLRQKQSEDHVYGARSAGMPKGSIQFLREPATLQMIYDHFASGDMHTMRINNKLCFTTYQAEKAYNQGA